MKTSNSVVNIGYFLPQKKRKSSVIRKCAKKKDCGINRERKVTRPAGRIILMVRKRTAINIHGRETPANPAHLLLTDNRKECSCYFCDKTYSWKTVAVHQQFSSVHGIPEIQCRQMK